MRNFNKKNALLIIIISFIFLFAISNFLFNDKETLFVDEASIEAFIKNSNTQIIYDYIKFREDVFVVGDNNKDYIKNVFPSSKFISEFHFRIYSRLRKNVLCFFSDDSLIEYAYKNNITYYKVVLDINSINKNEYLTLRDSNNSKIFLSVTNNNYTENNIDKDLIKVLDGDTITYNNNVYRFIGIDAPELEQVYGKEAKDYVSNLIKNSEKVSMLVSSYDIFDRILCHVLIDDVPLAYYMIEEKLAKETVLKYGDNGFSEIASNIVYLSKFQGRRKFTDPARYRRERR
ncbi:thermonuclease family protein [Brachyspira pilosicoli]|uniref:thermonuclease family protein n=1 Tax=Brachyspira pilosicoli TaxID=52584 RepID=UPI001C66B60C|nr:thermonuclease family protein [Brachyspira pilosicoli]MBW5396623.1 thermonuclease family protein [Brachyspira pilosicoli]